MSQLYSYSRVGCYFTCPAQYAHRYIQKTPSPLPEGVELFMGSRFHEAMEFLYQQVPRQVPPLPEVLDRFERFWDAGWNALQTKQKQRGFSTPIRILKEGEGLRDYHDRAKLFLERYYEKYQPFDQDRTLGLEKRVVFSLDSGGLFKMQGYIDRIARDKDGTVWVHDYKTGSRKLNPDDARNEDQLALYQLGLLQDPELKKSRIKMVWHYVAFEDDAVESERSDKELEGLRKRWIDKIQTLEKAKTFSTQTSALCGWCEFLPLCADGQAEVERRKRKKEGASPPAGSRDVPVLASHAQPPAAPSGPTSSVPLKSKLAASLPTSIPEEKPRPKGRSKKQTSTDPVSQLKLF